MGILLAALLIVPSVIGYIAKLTVFKTDKACILLAQGRIDLMDNRSIHLATGHTKDTDIGNYLGVLMKGSTISSDVVKDLHLIKDLSNIEVGETLVSNTGNAVQIFSESLSLGRSRIQILAVFFGVCFFGITLALEGCFCFLCSDLSHQILSPGNVLSEDILDVFKGHLCKVTAISLKVLGDLGRCCTIATSQQGKYILSTFTEHTHSIQPTN